MRQRRNTKQKTPPVYREIFCMVFFFTWSTERFWDFQQESFNFPYQDDIVCRDPHTARGSLSRRSRLRLSDFEYFRSRTLFCLLVLVLFFISYIITTKGTNMLHHTHHCNFNILFSGFLCLYLYPIAHWWCPCPRIRGCDMMSCTYGLSSAYTHRLHPQWYPSLLQPHCWWLTLSGYFMIVYFKRIWQWNWVCSQKSNSMGSSRNIWHCVLCSQVIICRYQRHKHCVVAPKQKAIHFVIFAIHSR